MDARRRLSPRKEAILRTLVDEYIKSGEPVASRLLSDALASVHGAGYGPATVRNELATLEEQGLIYQPHVSAGRVPTDLGYRYFVERLMGESRLALEEQRLIRHQFYQVQHQLDEWVRLTASIVAQALQSAAVVTPPRSDESRFKHFELLWLYESVVLIVLVLEDGTVRQERLLLDTPMSQEELSRLAVRFNEHLSGATAQTVAARIAEGAQGVPRTDSSVPGSDALSSNERLVAESLERLLAQLDMVGRDTFYAEGIARLLQHPQFRHGDPERVRKVVEALEQNRFLPSLAPQALSGEGVQVIIGVENEADALKDMSVILSRYGRPGQLSGFLGVVAPTRMQYSRAIALVRYMTHMLDDLLAETYGESYRE
ncbi:MAG TPA: heat-inducible transcriptional repressor HrcA [Ktedonobacterales bacterium]